MGKIISSLLKISLVNSKNLNFGIIREPFVVLVILEINYLCLRDIFASVITTVPLIFRKFAEINMFT